MNTTTAFTAKPAFVVTGGSLDVDVVVTGSIPAGTVDILDGAIRLASLPVVAGIAGRTLPLTGAGAHSLTASYVGDDYNYASVSTPVSVEVNETATSSPGAMTWIYGYDGNGNRWIDIDPNGHETDRNFDLLDRPYQILSPFFTGQSGTRALTAIGYDGKDNVATVQDPRNLSTSYSRDGLDNTLTLTSPDTGGTTATFDQAGNVLTRTDARGSMTTYGYDDLGRLTSATYTSGTPTAYTYDGGANPPPYSIGRLTKVTDESGTTEFTYDFRGNVVKKVQTLGTKVLTTSYGWGSTGGATAALTSVTYPSLARVNYLYDAFGRVNALTLNPVKPNGTATAATTLPLLSNVTYDGRGVVTGWTWSDGVVYKRTFDSYGRSATYPLGNPAGTGISAGLSSVPSYLTWENP